MASKTSSESDEPRRRLARLDPRRKLDEPRPRTRLDRHRDRATPSFTSTRKSGRVGIPIRDQTSRRASASPPTTRNTATAAARKSCSRAACHGNSSSCRPSRSKTRCASLVLVEGEPGRRRRLLARPHRRRRARHARLAARARRPLRRPPADRLHRLRLRTDVGRASAANVAASLVERGVDARIVELDRDTRRRLRPHRLPTRARRRRASARSSPPRSSTVSRALPSSKPLRAFLERDSTGRPRPRRSSALSARRHEPPAALRLVLPWGREGSGKTSVLVDLLFHVAAGRDWLHYPVGRPLRVVVIVNEGVPGGLQDKLAQKLELLGTATTTPCSTTSPSTPSTVGRLHLPQPAALVPRTHAPTRSTSAPTTSRSTRSTHSKPSRRRLTARHRSLQERIAQCVRELWQGPRRHHRPSLEQGRHGVQRRLGSPCRHRPAPREGRQAVGDEGDAREGAAGRPDRALGVRGAARLDRRDDELPPRRASTTVAELPSATPSFSSASSSTSPAPFHPVGMEALKKAVIGEPARIRTVTLDVAIERGIVANTSPRRNAYQLIEWSN